MVRFFFFLGHAGWCYANGRGITKNLFTAVRLFEAAADQGSIDALLELGEKHFNARIYILHALCFSTKKIN